MKKRIVKITQNIIIAILVFVVVVLGFLNLWPAFGGKVSQEDRQNYQKRSQYYDAESGKFRNEHSFKLMEKVTKNEKDNILSTKGTTPTDKIPTVKPTFKQNPSVSDLTVTWFGHASVLIQMHGMNILIDPIFSQRSSPVSFIGSKRFSDIPISIEELPQIDVLILSHNHFDHEDYNTLLKLKDKVKNFVVPLGVENDFDRWNFDMDKVHNMAWWEEMDIGGLTIGCTPSRHYSGRNLSDSYETLWASWVLKDEYHQIFDSGDTGYDTHFEEIYQKYGAFDLALLDCAQYDLRWPSVHMNPEESYMAAKALRTKYVMPIHWAAFQLANHPWEDPAVRYAKAAEGGNLTLLTPKIGETMDSTSFEQYQKHWWESIQ